jgi:hypothetical protein
MVTIQPKSGDVVLSPDQFHSFWSRMRIAATHSIVRPHTRNQTLSERKGDGYIERGRYNYIANKNNSAILRRVHGIIMFTGKYPNFNHLRRFTASTA